MPCVTLYTSLCFKTLLSLLPEAVAWNCGLLKNYLNAAEAKSQEMGPCSRSKTPSPSHHPCDTFPDWAICFLCPSPAFNRASLQNTRPWAPIFICSVSGKPFTMAWLLLSHVGLVCQLSKGAISSSPIWQEKCCSWPHNCLSRPICFHLAWASHGEEFLFFLNQVKTRGTQMRVQRAKH